MKKAKPAKDIDEYIARCPAKVQPILEMVRQSISKAAPNAQEVISYLMPAFKQHGMLVYSAAWKQHIGLYPPISGGKAIEKAVARYAGPKGESPIPTRRADSLCAHRTDREAASAAGQGEGGEEDEASNRTQNERTKMNFEIIKEPILPLRRLLRDHSDEVDMNDYHDIAELPANSPLP